MSGVSAEPPDSDCRTIHRGPPRPPGGADSHSGPGRSSMKSVIQVVVGVVVVCGGIFLVTFLSQYSRTKDVSTETPIPTRGQVAPNGDLGRG